MGARRFLAAEDAEVAGRPKGFGVFRGCLPKYTLFG